MAGAVSNLIMGPAEVWVGTFGATEPINATVALDAGFVDAGFTDGGVTLSLSQEYTPLEVDQIAMRVGSRLTKQEASIATAFAEAGLANLRSALNLATAAGTTLEIDAAISNGEPLYRSIILQGRGPTNLPRRVIIRRGLSVEAIEMAYTKDEKTVVPVTFAAHYVSSSIKAIKIDDTQGA